MKKVSEAKYSPYVRQTTSYDGNGTLFQYSMIIAAVAIFAALTIPFVVQENEILQANYQNGIDTVITGSIKKEAKRYRIRRSVLDIK